MSIEQGTVINAPGCQNCRLGELVAYVSGAYIPAAAVWDTSDVDGGVYPSDSSYIGGIVVSAASANGTAAIQLNGYITDPSVISGCLGTSAAAPGAYFLTSNGSASREVPNGYLPVYCGYKTNNALILQFNSPNYMGHRHTNYTLSGTYFTETASGGATYTGDSLFTQLLAAVPGNGISVLSGGIMLDSSQYSLTTSSLVLSEGCYTSGAVYTACAINPLVATNPEVRAIAPAPGNDVLKVTKEFGTVYLDTDYPEVSDESTGFCIAAISKEGVVRSPVINKLSTGGILSLSYQGNGEYTLAADGNGTYLDFQTINANNALIGSTVNDAIITFPASVPSSVLGIVRLPHLGAVDGVVPQWKLKIFLWVTGDSTSVSLSCNVKTYDKDHINNPATNNNINISGVSGEILVPAESVEGENDNYITAAGDSLVQIELIASAANAAAIRVRAAGVYLLGTVAEG